MEDRGLSGAGVFRTTTQQVVWWESVRTGQRIAVWVSSVRDVPENAAPGHNYLKIVRSDRRIRRRQPENYFALKPQNLLNYYGSCIQEKDLEMIAFAGVEEDYFRGSVYIFNEAATAGRPTPEPLRPTRSGRSMGSPAPNAFRPQNPCAQRAETSC